MIENILARKGISLKIRLTVKSLVSAGVIILAVMLPQLVHLAAGPSGGMTWLPMYLPYYWAAACSARGGDSALEFSLRSSALRLHRPWGARCLRPPVCRS